MKTKKKKLSPEKAWDKWFDSHVIVEGFGRKNKKAKAIIKDKVLNNFIRKKA